MDNEIHEPMNKKLIGITVAIIGFIASIISIYAFFIQDNKPNLVCELLSESNVFDINADVSELKILYNDKNLKESKSILKLVQIRFINNGTGDILINHFDDKYPVIINVENGELVEKPEVVQTSNDYLSSILKIIVDKNKLEFPSFILDKNQYFVIKLLVLCRDESNLKIIPSGKIAGQNEIKLVDKIESSSNPSFFITVFQGNVFIQIVRAFVYTVASIAIGMAIGFMISGINSIVIKKRRNKDVRKFLINSDIENTKQDQIILNMYKEGQYYLLNQINNRLMVENDINEYIMLERKLQNKRTNLVHNYEEIYKYQYNRNRNLGEKMIEMGLIYEEDNKYKVNKKMLITLQKFVSYIKENNKKEYDRINYTMMM